MPTPASHTPAMRTAAMHTPAIVVPLDGSEAALAALPVARVLAEIEHVPLRIVHVAARSIPDAELPGRLHLRKEDLDDTTTGIAVRAGKAAPEILRLAAEDAGRMIVLCTHAAHAPGGGLGRTAIGLLREAPFPLVLVPPDRGAAAWRLQHILVPHDGTPRTSAALRPAVELAEHAGADLLVAHVAGVAGAAGARVAAAEPGSLPSSPYVDQPQHEWPAWTGEFAKRLAGLCPLGRVHARVLLARGSPAAEVGRLARERSADLIVLAWRGLWEPRRAATVKDILAAARCPIMMVRA